MYNLPMFLFRISFAVFTILSVSVAYAHDTEVELPYLTNHGAFLLDDHELDSFNDQRNPKLIISDTDEETNSQSIFYLIFSLSPNDTDYGLNAENCKYQYVGSKPDPYYFPQSKRSIWDLFKLEPSQLDECLQYKLLATRSPHGEYPEIHMHFRYGNTNFNDILSKKYSDPDSQYSWWSTYEATAKFTPLSHDYSYLNVNGVFVMDQDDPATLNDARNPSKIEFTTTDEPYSESRFVFYKYGKPNKVWADCNFQFVKSAPDPHYFPQYKTSVWDFFKLTTKNSGKCNNFKFVILRSPHGEPAHAHVRYGGKTSSFKQLLEDSLNPNAWWSTYIESGK